MRSGGVIGIGWKRRGRASHMDELMGTEGAKERGVEKEEGGEERVEDGA
jgi:hypothetical protein